MAELLDLTVAADLANGLAVMAAKGLIILLVVTAVCIALGNAPASLKHLCWGLGLCALLVLPFLSLMVPDWNVGFLDGRTTFAPAPMSASQPGGDVHAPTAKAADPNSSEVPNSETYRKDASIADRYASATTAGARASMSAAAARASVSAAGAKASVNAAGARATTNAGSTEASTKASGEEASTNTDSGGQSIDGAVADAGREASTLWRGGWPVAAWILAIWALGAAALLLHMLFSSLLVWRIVANARPVTDRAWLDMLEEVGDRLFVRRPVQLLESPRVSVPVAWGAIRPVILIPPGAATWSDERRRCVLAHELAHVKRWDTVTQSAARLACAVHWFNPLVWKAAGAMQLEREKACDDYVLVASRARASEYASHLLDIARRVPGSISPPVGAIAMARRSQLEGRVLAILDEGRRRSLPRFPMAVAVIATLLIVLPIAAMSPYSAPRSDDAEPTFAEMAVTPGTVWIAGESPRSKPAAQPDASARGATTASKEKVGKTPRDTIERSFNVADGGLVVIDADHGNVRLKSGASGVVHVRVRRTPRGNAAPEDYEVSFDQDGDRISIIGTNTIRNSGRNAVNVDYEVTVPLRFDVDAETAGGNIAVDNLNGRVKLNTSGGNLSLGRITGQVDAHTSGGNISLDGSEGNVVVNTSGGNISLGRVGGTVMATTSGGNISVDEVNGEITAKTSGGQISARIARQPKADCLLRTSGGSIAVYLADDVAVDLEAATSAGHVETDVEVAAIGRIKKDRLHGKINGGGPLLELDTSAGDIRIMRL